MNRRNAVRNLAIASGGLITLPFWMSACNTDDKNAGKDAPDSTHRTSFSADQQEILAKITDAIIPPGPATASSAAAGGTPSAAGTSSAAAPNAAEAADASIGALSAGVDKYLQKFIDDCCEPAVQQNVKKQLLALDASAKNAHGNSFTGCTLPQRQALLLNRQDSASKDEKDFFGLMKTETIRGFNTSQKVMEDYYHYKVAPGHYY